MRQPIGEVGLADASSQRHHLVDRTEGLAGEQRTRETDRGEDHYGHAEEEPATGPHNSVRIVKGHRHVDGVARLANSDRHRDHPDRLVAEVVDRPEYCFAVAQKRQQCRWGVQVSAAKGDAPRNDTALQVGDLH